MPSPQTEPGKGTPAAIAAVLGRPDRVPAKQALASAPVVLEALQGAALDPLIGISREGSVVLTLHRGSRLVSYECDAEGDVILLFSDRASAEPSAEVLSPPAVGESIERALAFLGG